MNRWLRYRQHLSYFIQIRAFKRTRYSSYVIAQLAPGTYIMPSEMHLGSSLHPCLFTKSYAGAPCANLRSIHRWELTRVCSRLCAIIIFHRRDLMAAGSLKVGRVDEPWALSPGEFSFSTFTPSLFVLIVSSLIFSEPVISLTSSPLRMASSSSAADIFSIEQPSHNRR